MFGILISTSIIIVVIKAFTGGDVSFGSAFVAAFSAGIASRLLITLACPPLESDFLTFTVSTIIHFVVAALAVSLFCSTDVKHVLMISGTFAGFCLVSTVLAICLSAD
jgi:hypothetical protein